MRVVFLTTSYPRMPGDAAGAFVADAVDAVREAGIEVEVVSPAAFRHFGVAYGHGVVGNLRAAPWKVLLLPAFLLAFVRAARRAARGADVVHAHWIPSGLVALATRRPVVLQVWGTDVELARRAPWLARPILRRARVVVAASTALAGEARALGARDVRVIPSPVAIPDEVGEPDDPPHVLFAGRLSEEKGLLEFLEATEGLPRVIVGDGPLRDRGPEAVGFVPHEQLGGYYERAAVVACPSRREGYGVVAREALAHGRPLVATTVGGLADVVDDEVAIVVPPADVGALRAAIERLLRDASMRDRLGAAAATRAREQLAAGQAGAALVAAYRDAQAGAPAPRSPSSHSADA
jgi:glycosyltransferase involved in cell wall biosynthesis